MMIKIFENIYNKRLDKIEELSKKIDYNNVKNLNLIDQKIPCSFLTVLKGQNITTGSKESTTRL